MSENLDVTHPHVYTTSAHSFSLQLSTGTVQAVGGLLRLTDAEEAELQRLLKGASGRPDLIQAMRKRDLSQAAALARKALAEMSRPAASRGASTTADNPRSAIAQEKVTQSPNGLLNKIFKGAPGAVQEFGPDTLPANPEAASAFPSEIDGDATGQ